jgi:hypothetical protein
MRSTLIRANAYAAIELKNVWPSVIVPATMNEFRRNTQKSRVAVDM